MKEYKNKKLYKVFSGRTTQFGRNHFSKLELFPEGGNPGSWSPVRKNPKICVRGWHAWVGMGAVRHMCDEQDIPKGSKREKLLVFRTEIDGMPCGYEGERGEAGHDLKVCGERQRLLEQVGEFVLQKRKVSVSWGAKADRWFWVYVKFPVPRRHFPR